MSFNAYKIKKELYDLLLCEPCLKDIEKRNGIKKSEKEKIEVYWESLQTSPELQ